jgi:hypothetical protein
VVWTSHGVSHRTTPWPRSGHRPVPVASLPLASAASEVWVTQTPLPWFGAWRFHRNLARGGFTVIWRVAVSPWFGAWRFALQCGKIWLRVADGRMAADALAGSGCQ